MAMSLIRSLTASAVRNVSALKRDAKRLQKHSKVVFGEDYPLSVCQHAIAASRGFRSLQDLDNFIQRLGKNKEAPFWSIVSRNDKHQSALSAIYRLGLDFNENGPLIFTGEQKASTLPALVMFLEQISQKKLPGIIIVETEAASFQDTLVMDSVQQLETDEIIDGFRTLDLRDRNLPVALNTEARWWVNAIMDALPHAYRKELHNTGWSARLESSAYENAKSRRQIFGSDNFQAIPFYSIKMAAYESSSRLQTSTIELHTKHGDSETSPSDSSTLKSLKDSVFDIIKELDNRNFDVGTSCEHESRKRPYIILFSRNDKASEVLASVVHSYFYWRQDRDNPQPILYVSDGHIPYAPRFLSFGGHTAVVNGLDAIPVEDDPKGFYGYKNALKVIGTSSGLQFMGKRVSIE